MTAANQQERLSITEQQKWFLAGFIEGEGSVCISIKEHPTAQFGYYVDPEFFLYQHRAYPQMLELAQVMFGSGRIFPKQGNETVLVFCEQILGDCCRNPRSSEPCLGGECRKGALSLHGGQ